MQAAKVYFFARAAPILCRMANFGENLSARRDELALTNSAIARRLGLSEQRIGQYMNGRRLPDIQTLAALATALDTTADALLGRAPAGAAPSAAPIIARIFELEGAAPDRAAILAQVVLQALQVLRELGGDPLDPDRSRIAAQAAWSLQPALKPSK